MKYMRDGLKDEYGILKLQDKLLEIMVYIDNLCQKYNIDYCLMAGSALGARRHNGFIPWDDDIDIYMTEIEYEKFKAIFKACGDSEKYYLQEWGKTSYRGKSFITMAKIRENQTFINEKAYSNWKIHQGVFVDIFILHTCPNKKIDQKKQYIWSEAVVLKGLETRGYSPKNKKDKLMLFVSKMIPKSLILKYGLNNTYKYMGEDTNYYHGFIDTRDFSRAIFSKDIMFPTKYVEFEKVKLKVPANNDVYLTIQFGSNYMDLPPESERPINKHSDSWKMDSQIRYNNLSDERKLI